MNVEQSPDVSIDVALHGHEQVAYARRVDGDQIAIEPQSYDRLLCYGAEPERGPGRVSGSRLEFRAALAWHGEESS